MWKSSTSNGWCFGANGSILFSTCQQYQLLDDTHTIPEAPVYKNTINLFGQQYYITYPLRSQGIRIKWPKLSCKLFCEQIYIVNCKKQRRIVRDIQKKTSNRKITESNRNSINCNFTIIFEVILQVFIRLFTY